MQSNEAKKLYDIKTWVPKPIAASCSLADRAKVLWPDNDALQEKWIAAVQMVRRTPKGWVCDQSEFTPKGRR
jgi:hypothetical protein